jgi:hypothetical protein
MIVSAPPLEVNGNTTDRPFEPRKLGPFLGPQREKTEYKAGQPRRVTPSRQRRKPRKTCGKPAIHLLAAAGLEPARGLLPRRILSPPCGGLKPHSEQQDTSNHPESLAHPLAHEPQDLARPGPVDPLDLAAAAAALAELPEADRRAALDALADALRALPLGERPRLAGRLLDGADK